MRVKLSEIRVVVREEVALFEGKLTGQALRDELMGIAVEMGDDQGWDIRIDPSYLVDTLADQSRHSSMRWSSEEAHELAKQIADDWNATTKRRANRPAWMRRDGMDEALQFERKMREADLVDGTKAPWGSPQHVKELETSVRDLEHHRKQQRRGSDARATYGRALQRLKAQLKSAKREAEKRRAEAQKKRAKPLKEARRGKKLSLDYGIDVFVDNSDREWRYLRLEDGEPVARQSKRSAGKRFRQGSNPDYEGYDAYPLEWRRIPDGPDDVDDWYPYNDDADRRELVNLTHLHRLARHVHGLIQALKPAAT